MKMNTYNKRLSGLTALLMAVVIGFLCTWAALWSAGQDVNQETKRFREMEDPRYPTRR